MSTISLTIHAPTWAFYVLAAGFVVNIALSVILTVQTRKLRKVTQARIDDSLDSLKRQFMRVGK